MSHHKSRGSREDHRGRSSSGRRPPLGGGGGGPGAQGGPGGDWTCPEDGCANVNFARRAECNRCGAVKPSVGAKLKAVGIEIGTNMAEKSGGLFSADDWQCGKCGNVNWARRSTCNVCNGPRVTEIEQRTGLGGGFNERQDRVEYKRHDSDSDEYDDFESDLIRDPPIHLLEKLDVVHIKPEALDRGNTNGPVLRVHAQVVEAEVAEERGVANPGGVEAGRVRDPRTPPRPRPRRHDPAQEVGNVDGKG
eukprot:TCALIF_00800-PA protein Name:"Similar to ZRANB2 Zinc finger Ran-binding domain-containing protein 2 (Gallus gallus)" AED:0.18 eAED:0.18 QI:413/0.33/0.25/1/0.66/0.75/4/0/248